MGARILWLNPVGTAALDQPMAALLGRIKKPGTGVSVMSFALDAPLDHLNFRAYEALTHRATVSLIAPVVVEAG